LVSADLESKELKYFDSLKDYNYEVHNETFEYLNKIRFAILDTPLPADNWIFKIESIYYCHVLIQQLCIVTRDRVWFIFAYLTRAR